jgi:hypothetical protein
LSNLFYTYKLFLFECFQFLTFTKSLDLFYYLHTYLYSQFFINIFYFVGNSNNPFFLNFKYIYNHVFVSSITTTTPNLPLPSVINYQADSTTPISTAANTLYQYSEHSLLGAGRITRYSLPLVSYDYKCGNYLGIWEKLYPHLIVSFIEVARGIRKPS